jgi:uncharacterized membrane protein YidH (DUF202 family)
MRNLLKNKTAAGGVVVALISMMVMILVGVIVVNALVNSQTPDDTWSADANTTWENLQTNIWIAFGLVVVGVIIVGAVAILSYLKFGGAGA